MAEPQLPGQGGGWGRGRSYTAGPMNGGVALSFPRRKQPGPDQRLGDWGIPVLTLWSQRAWGKSHPGGLPHAWSFFYLEGLCFVHPERCTEDKRQVLPFREAWRGLSALFASFCSCTGHSQGQQLVWGSPRWCTLAPLGTGSQSPVHRAWHRAGTWPHVLKE